MLVYRDASREESTQEKLDRLRRLAGTGDTLAFLVEIGELEQGVVDALHPVADGLSRQRVRLRTAARAAGSAFIESRNGRAATGALRRAETVLDALGRDPLPARIRVQPPEGYVHYALDPGGYAAAAASYRAAVGTRRASRAIVVGVRSIGTSLSAVVAAELGAYRSVTVRPRGDTGHRHVRVDRALTRCLVRWTHQDADVVIVDEGPGATGETFEVVADWVRSIGLAEDRIVLVPSRAWGMPLAAEARRDWFDAARKFAPPHEDDRAHRIARRHGLPRPHDLSAGRWRTIVPGATAEPARIAHERLKFLAGSPHTHDARLIRYAGLGRWGAEAVERASLLAEAGIGPALIDHDEGFLICHWRPGRPAARPMDPANPADSAHPADSADTAPSANISRAAHTTAATRDAAGADPELLSALDRYLCTRVRLFRTGHTAERQPLIAMLVQNAGEALSRNARGLAAAVRRLERLPAVEAVVPDARLQPREWIRSPDGYHKVDAVDHGVGLRLPGPTDPAWDLAAAAVELRIDDSTVARLARRYARAADRDAPGMLAAVVAHRAPYAALALGDATISAREANIDEERRRLEAEAAWYRAALRRELERIDSVAA